MAIDDLESGVTTSPQLIDSKPAATPRVPKKLDVQDVIGRPKPNGYPEGPVSEDGQSPLSLRINSLTREARKESISELREFVSYYKEGIATLQDFIIGEIIDDPDITLEKLNFVLDEFRDELGISKDQYQLFRFILSEYSIRHSEIEKVRERFTDEEGWADGEKIFEAAFGFPSQGAVDVEFGPITMNFYIGNREDYINAYNGVDVNSLGPEKRDKCIKIASDSKGAFIAGESPQFDISLNGSMVLIYTNIYTGHLESEDEDEFYNTSLERTRVHEEGHAISRFLVNQAKTYADLKASDGGVVPADIKAFLEARPITGSVNRLEKRAELETKGPVHSKIYSKIIEEELKLALLDERLEYEELIKEEALAHFIDGSSMQDIFLTISSITQETVTTEWIAKAISNYTEALTENRRSLVEREIRLIFEDSFRRLINRSINGMFLLQKHFEPSVTIALLRTIPLRRWPAEIRRILKAKAVRESELRKGQNIDEANS